MTHNRATLGNVEVGKSGNRIIYDLFGDIELTTKITKN